MKKIFLIFIMLISVTGCTYVNFNNYSYQQIIDDSLDKNIKYSNNNFNGYKLYIPRGLKVVDKDEYNLIILNDEDVYYLYVDVISYHYKTNNEITKSSNSIFSSSISHNNLNGFIDISKYDDKYFVQANYNYSKIQGFVSEKNINRSLVYMISILSSIDYNENVINTLIDKDLLDNTEEKFNFFESKNDTSNFLEALEKYDVYIEKNTDEDSINIDFEQ